MNALVFNDIDQGIHKIKIKITQNEEPQKIHGFSLYINVANFEVFLRTLNFRANHLFWRLVWLQEN